MSNQEFRPGGFQILPPVVKNILIVTVLMFVLQLIMEARGIDLSDYLGLHYFQAPLFKPHQFVTYIFMHGNFMHIFFNMFALWMFGSVLENVWGGKRFLIFYLITGMGAALIQLVVYYFEVTPVLNELDMMTQNGTAESFRSYLSNSPYAEQYNAALAEGSSYAVSVGKDILTNFRADYLNSLTVVGASGSLFGILLAFAMLFPNTYLNIYFFIPIKAKYFVMLYGAIEIISAIRNDPNDNVAHIAHLGGMLFGFILIKIWQRGRSNFY
jgi:membrane associated rhomboid family serine protease